MIGVSLKIFFMLLYIRPMFFLYSRSRAGTFYIIGEQTKGVEHQGFWSGFVKRPGRSTILIDL